MNYTDNELKQRDAVSDTPRTDAEEEIDNGDTKPLFEFCRQLERELSEVNKSCEANRKAYHSAISDCVKLQRELAAVTAERDALKAKLATINHIAISLFVRATSSEVTGEMAEIGRLSREDGQ